jgi:hypothetical protein
MASRLSSARFRRRLLWAGSAVAATGFVVGGALWIGNTGRRFDDRLVDRPAWVYREPEETNLTKAQRREVLDLMARFIESAVARKQLDSAYDLTLPELRGTITRSQWRTGNIPVVPFPAVGIYDMTLDYSYPGDVAYDVAVVGDRGGIKTFLIEMKQAGKGAGAHWKVAAWVPKGVGGGSTPVAERHPEPAGPPPRERGRLSAVWLLIPVSILALILLVPVALGVRNWREGRRALRAYEGSRELPPLPPGYSSTSRPS